jgi:hypothetical protein
LIDVGSPLANMAVQADVAAIARLTMPVSYAQSKKPVVRMAVTNGNSADTSVML